MDRTNFPQRKHIRLPNFDYSSNGAYFITICTKERKQILSQIEKTISNEAFVSLLPMGKIVQQFILEIPKHYLEISLLSYVIMPDHVHILLYAKQNDDSIQISRIIKAFKRLSAKACGERIWQDRYNDHVIRNEMDLQTKIEYIETNPLRKLLKDEKL